MNADSRPWLRAYAALGKDWHRVPELPPFTLSDYVRSHARSFGDREALVFLGRGITYAELDRLSDRFASLLSSLGCTRGDVLAIHLPNTPQYVAALIAASRAGVVTTAISPLMAPTEIALQMNDAKAKLLLTLDSLLAASVWRLEGLVPTLQHVLVSAVTELVPGAPKAGRASAALGSATVHTLTEALERAEIHPTRSTPVPLTDVLYLMYTGGTTGMPKGAQLTSENLLVNCLQGDVFYGYRTGRETVASAFPLFHIGGTAVLVNALRTASTFILLPDPRNVDHLCGEMKARPPTVLAAVPALFQMLLANPSFRALDFTGLRVAISGAAPFAEAEVNRLEEVVGKGKFCEVYGMTETSPVQTLNPAARFKPGFVGVPLPGTEVRIVDAETLATLPSGEVGEIIASGPQVMTGYLGMPEADARALRSIDGRTWMLTGDVGLMDDEGYVKVCDRSKDMLIVGGYKVFSVEVENRLKALPFIAACAVVGKPDLARPGNDIVQLYVQRVPGDPTAADERRDEILAFCRANLSPYKVPRELHFIDAIPLTSVGKIDKKALRGRA